MTHTIEIGLRQEKDYRFAIDFGAGVPVLYADEAPPVGGGRGPSPEQLLAAAVGNCMADSLYFALRKFKQDPLGITAVVKASVGRNADGRLRVQLIEVAATLGALAASIEHLDRALAQFEDFCTVAQSVGQGIPIAVSVYDGTGVKIK